MMRALIICISFFVLATNASAQGANRYPSEAIFLNSERIRSGITESTWEGCLPGSQFLKIPVRAGSKITILSSITNSCDIRGWTVASNVRFFGPQGDYQYGTGLVAGDHTPRGMLIGAFESRELNAFIDFDTLQHIFSGRSLYLGGTKNGTYITMSPIDGYLYILMNDGNGYDDNVGSIRIMVTTESK